MTLDVNLARQPKLADGSNAAIVAAAISLTGSRHIVRRVRVVGWGTYTISDPDTNKSGECFPIYMVGALGTGVTEGQNIIEDCVVEHPALSQAREATILNNHTYYQYLSVFCTLRNNYLNGDRVVGTPELSVPVSSLSYSGGVLTVTTRWPHRLSASNPQDDVVLAGATGTNAASYNKRFTVATVTSETTFTINATLPTPVPSAAGMSARRYVPGPLRVKNVTNLGTTVTVETFEPHYRKTGDYIRISGVRTGAQAEDNYFNGSYPVASVPSDVLLTYTADGTLGAIDSALRNFWLDRWPSQLVKITPLSLSWQAFGSNGLVTVSTKMPHYLAPNEFVLLAGIDALWNGYYKVTAVNNSRQFVFLKMGNTHPPYPPDSNAYSTAQIPQLLQALTATAGYGGRLYGNRISDVYTGGPYHDLGPDVPLGSPAGVNREKDCSAWNNYYYFVYVGPFCNVANRLTTEPPNYDDRQLWNIAHDNIIDLQPWPVGGWNEGPQAGMAYWGRYATTNTFFPAIETVIARDNMVRFVDWNQGPVPSNNYVQYGMDFASVRHVVADDNLVTMTMKTGVPALSTDGVQTLYPPNTNPQNWSTNGSLLSFGTRSHSLLP